MLKAKRSCVSHAAFEGVLGFWKCAEVLASWGWQLALIKEEETVRRPASPMSDRVGRGQRGKQQVAPRSKP